LKKNDHIEEYKHKSSLYKKSIAKMSYI